MIPNGRVPLWQQILEDLRGRIDTGEISGRFPTDVELMASYGVSRHTVREALRCLVAEGVLERQRGRGSHLRREDISLEQPIGVLYSLFRAVEAEGRSQNSIVRRLEARSDAQVSARLGQTPEALLVYLERLRLVDGWPLALDKVWLPGHVAYPLLDSDFTHTALYDELESRCGMRPRGGRERIHPVVLARDEARLLGLPAGSAAFGLERSTWSQPGEPIEWRYSVVRGDCYTFVSEWSGASTDVVLSFEAL